ncbi:MAG: protein prkA, partial [Dehalococcoidia bacterium]
MDLDKLLEECRLEQEKLAWDGTFSEYLGMVIKNPHMVRLSHARVYDMLVANGVEVNNLGERQYKLFSGEVYGLERPLARLVDYFSSAAGRLEVRKRMLLLLGPPSTGKSTIVNILKKGLEEYTKTDGGALYAIGGCPMQEEPLHLIPERLRPDFEKEYGIYIEGDLCHHCRYLLRDKYHGRVQDVEVERMVLSEREGIGIGTYVATDPESQDISRLVGTVDNSIVGKDRVETAGKAYRLDGELNVASRGIMDFIEMFKCNERFLTALVTVTQEQTIKMGRFGTVYADEVIIAHSNEADYREFVENRHTEALQDRIVMVKIPYNLRVSEEVRIYEKLLRGTEAERVHFAPLATKLASMVAVLSRLDPPSKGGMSMMEKLALYDGRYVSGFTRKDVEDMQNKAHNEGLTGISPRYVVNRLSALSADPDVKCVGPLMVLEALADGLEQHIPLYEKVTQPVDGQPRPARSRLTGLTAQEEYRERLQTIFSETRKEYSILARKELQQAFVGAVESEAQKAFDSYVGHVEAYLDNTRVVDAESVA